MKKLYILLIAISSTVLFNSCAESETSFFEDAEALGFTGSEDDILQFFQIDAELYDQLLDLGITVNEGANPPNVEGTFNVDPRIVSATNIPGDGFEIGEAISSARYTFSNQNDEDRSIQFSSQQYNPETGELVGGPAFGDGSFVSGDGNDFTIIVRTSSTSTGSEGNTITLSSANIISGTLSNSGVLNFEIAFVLIEKKNDINNEFVEIGEGRAFQDGDSVSEYY